jgi:thiosulfate/3-mercaptopyruvate sulfurtransferase
MTYERYSRSGIIEPEELHALLLDDAQNIKIVDATYALPNSGIEPHTTFSAKRIGSAVFFDIDKISDHHADLPHMLPNAHKFEIDVADLGLSNQDLIVIYGQSGIVMGPARAWWMFKTFGHDRVCVLNGGLPAWIRAGFDLNTQPPSRPSKGAFKATLRPELVVYKNQMLSALDGNVAILDARPTGRFNGAVPEPRSGLHSGHIPGSLSLPSTDLLNAETGKLKTRDQLEDIFASLGVAQDSEVFTTCGSGVTACMITLALHHVYNKTGAVYDGSWSEWGLKDAQMPIETSNQ